MSAIRPRIERLERAVVAQSGHIRAWLEVEDGQTPLEALEGQPPGMYVLLDRYGRMPGMMGRVSPSGKREVIFGQPTEGTP